MFTQEHQVRNTDAYVESIHQSGKVFSSFENDNEESHGDGWTWIEWIDVVDFWKKNGLCTWSPFF